MIYKVDIWCHHSKIDFFESNDAKELNNWIIENGYSYSWGEGNCAIYVYKNGVDLSLTEQENEGINWTDYC